MEPLAHASIGLMVKPFAPRAPLWPLLAATTVPDLLCFGFMAAGMEYGAVTQLDLNGLRYLGLSFIPWSHGLCMSIIWSVAVAGIAFLFLRDRRTSVVMGLLVFSHWLLDFIVYIQVPIFFDNSQLTGLGLITSGPGLMIGIILELGLIGGGIAAYWAARRRAHHVRTAAQLIEPTYGESTQ